MAFKFEVDESTLVLRFINSKFPSFVWTAAPAMAMEPPTTSPHFDMWILFTMMLSYLQKILADGGVLDHLLEPISAHRNRIVKPGEIWYENFKSTFFRPCLMNTMGEISMHEPIHKEVDLKQLAEVMVALKSKIQRHGRLVSMRVSNIKDQAISNLHTKMTKSSLPPSTDDAETMQLIQEIAHLQNLVDASEVWANFMSDYDKKTSANNYPDMLFWENREGKLICEHAGTWLKTLSIAAEKAVEIGQQNA